MVHQAFEREDYFDERLSLWARFVNGGRSVVQTIVRAVGNQALVIVGTVLAAYFIGGVSYAIYTSHEIGVIEGENMIISSQLTDMRSDLKDVRDAFYGGRGQQHTN